MAASKKISGNDGLSGLTGNPASMLGKLLNHQDMATDDLSDGLGVSGLLGTWLKSELNQMMKRSRTNTTTAESQRSQEDDQAYRLSQGQKQSALAQMLQRSQRYR